MSATSGIIDSKQYDVQKGENQCNDRPLVGYHYQMTVAVVASIAPYILRVSLGKVAMSPSSDDDSRWRCAFCTILYAGRDRGVSVSHHEENSGL